jgi:propionyl-CoA synthetase
MSDSEGFWAEAAEQLHRDRRCRRVLDDSNLPFSRRFSGGELDTCDNAVERRVEMGRGEQRARLDGSPLTGVLRTFT